MMSPKDLARKVIEGKDLSRSEALRLVCLDDRDKIDELLQAAGELTRSLHGSKASLCAIVNAKSGLCPEDCSFCAQSLKFQSGVKRYPLLEPEEILKKARLAEERGAHEFCIVTSGKALTEGEFEQLLSIVNLLRRETALQVDVSPGFLTLKQAQRLKEAGVTRINHNIQTSPRFYGQIVTTHSYSDRTATLQSLREAGLEVCSGVILGLGETREDRVEAALELRKFSPECVPINLLDPRPGTPLAQSSLLDPMEIVKTIAVFRLILPRTNLRLAGGRRLQLGSFQKLALRAGINGLIIGEYLTTPGSPLEEDFTNLREAGYPVIQGKEVRHAGGRI